MMLQALLGYAERRMNEDPAFSDPDLESVNLHWLIPLNASGKLSGGPIPLTTFEGKKKVVRKARRPATSVNEISVRSLEKAKSYFLCDTLERVLLLNETGGESADSLVQARHRYFKRLLRDASPSSPEAANAIVSFLDNSEELARCRTLLVEFKADSSENCTFQVLGQSGQSVLDDAGLIGFWRQQRASTVAKAGEQQICLVTGQLANTVGTTEKIKGIGGQDTNLISANEKSFQSYGLEQAKNSPISSRAEKLTRAALNELIAKSFRTGDKQSIYHLHWTREPVPTDIFALLESADEAAVRNLLAAPQTGHAPVGVKPNAYYAMSLSGNGGRIVVRDWLESTVPEVEANIRRWFEHLSIVNSDGTSIESAFKVWALLAALVPKKKGKPDYDKLPPQLLTQLLYAALRGTPLPQTALTAALRRQQIEENKLNPARIALIKACLIRSQNRKETDSMTEKLDIQSKDRAYLCGQLFAVVGRLQLLALGKIGASLADRTYGGIATRPATTFGPVFTKLPAYLKKANTRFPGSGTNKQKELEILCQRIEELGGIPQILGLEDQGRFALGYYCQLAQYRTDRAEADAAKKAEELADEIN